MTNYDNTNRGVLFRNDRKEKDTHADYNGSINVEGQEFWLNAWLNEKNGKKYFSLAVKPKAERADNSDQPSKNSYAEATGASPDGIDDEVPF